MSHVTANHVVVEGSLSQANGTAVGLTLRVEGISVPSGMVYRLEVDRSRFSVEFEASSNGSESSLFSLAQLTTHVVEAAVLPNVLMEGVGVRIRPELCRLSGREVPIPVPWVASGSSNVPLETVADVMGRYPMFRYAVRDFNEALAVSENAPLFLYRALETTARAILDHEGEITSREWDRFHQRLRTSKAEFGLLQRINESHRHGDHAEFTPQQQVAMMAAIQRVLWSALRILAESTGSQPASVDERPPDAHPDG
jgi:hypothetical protein